MNTEARFTQLCVVLLLLDFPATSTDTAYKSETLGTLLLKRQSWIHSLLATNEVTLGIIFWQKNHLAFTGRTYIISISDRGFAFP